MFIRQVGGIVVFVAFHTTEQGVIPGCRVAFPAIVPFIAVIATVNGKIHVVMVEIRRCPSCFCMAISTRRRKLRRTVVGAVGVVVVRLMASDTSRGRPREPIGVASYAVGLRMRTAQWKGRLVVVVKPSWHPTRGGGVALGAVRPDACIAVVGLCGGVVFGLMASHAGRRRTRERTIRMALETVGYSMTHGQREKVVAQRAARPSRRKYIMASGAFNRKPSLHVVGGHRRLKICRMATDAVVPKPIEAERRFRYMAFHTTDVRMHPIERKSIIEVDALHVVHQPVVGGVAAVAVVAHGALVDVRVAGDTIRRCGIKHQCLMAIPTVGSGVPPVQRKPRLVVRKRSHLVGIGHSSHIRSLSRCFAHWPIFPSNGPSVGRMAGRAIDF